MSRLNPEDLAVDSFDTTEPVVAEPGVVVVRETNEDPNCWSPLCGPTFWKGCEETQ